MLIDASTHTRKNSQITVPGGKRRPRRPSMNTIMMIANPGHMRSPAPIAHHRKYPE